MSFDQYIKSSKEENIKAVAISHRKIIPQTSVIKLSTNFTDNSLKEREGNETRPVTRIARKVEW